MNDVRNGVPELAPWRSKFFNYAMLVLVCVFFLASWKVSEGTIGRDYFENSFAALSTINVSSIISEWTKPLAENASNKQIEQNLLKPIEETLQLNQTLDLSPILSLASLDGVSLPPMEPAETTNNRHDIPFHDSILITNSPKEKSSFSFQLMNVNNTVGCATFWISHATIAVTNVSYLQHTFSESTQNQQPARPSKLCNLRIIKRTRASQKISWQPIYGQHAVHLNDFVEDTISFTNEQWDDQQIAARLVIRAYDHGIAWNLKLFQPFRWQTHLPPDVLNYDLGLLSQLFWQGNGVAHIDRGAEKGFFSSRLHKKPSWKDLGMLRFPMAPMYVQLDSGIHVALMEARNWDFKAVRFHLLGSSLKNIAAEFVISLSKETSAVFSPWWLMIVGKTAPQVLSHHFLIENLNDPSVLQETFYIKPGSVYRAPSLNIVEESIKFSAELAVKYVLIDAGWYGSEYNQSSDATKAVKIDVKKALESCAKHNVGLFLYVNDIHLKQQIEQIVPLYASWGVKGIKFGFVDIANSFDTRRIMSYVALCAKYNLMVNIHDYFRPTGLSRTFPNLVSHEGIRGDEHSPHANHSLYLPFTRFLSGGADHTFVLDPDRLAVMQKTILHQIALPICLYNALQHLLWYLNVYEFQKKWDLEEMEPLFSVWHALPTTWRNSFVLKANPISLFTVARESYNEDWYIASINQHPISFALKLLFLPKGQHYTAEIFTDVVDQPMKFSRVLDENVTSNTKIQVTMQWYSGHIIRLRKRSKSI